MTIRIGILSLAYCAGCETTLISVEDLYELIIDGKVRIEYSTLITDQEELKSVDVLFVTGAIRRHEDVRQIKEACNKASKIIAFGSCSCYGGIPGLANLVSREEILSYVFGDLGPQTSIFKHDLMKAVIPLQAITKVDYIIPGCPPPVSLIKSLLKSLIEGTEFKLPIVNVCKLCPFNTDDKKPIKELRRRILAYHDIDLGTCYLKQGILCMGPATLGACEAFCIRRGGLCIGCLGPLPESKDQAADIIDTLSIFYQIELPEKILEAVPDPVGLFSTFTLPYSSIPCHRKVCIKEVERNVNRD